MEYNKYSVRWVENGIIHICSGLSKRGVHVLICKLVCKGVDLNDIRIRKEEEQ